MQPGIDVGFAFEVDTDATGLAAALAGLALINVIDCKKDASLLAVLRARCEAGAFIYRREKDDRWTSFKISQQRFAGKPAIIDDCDVLAAILLAGVTLFTPWPAWASITHPYNSNTAHAYGRVDGPIENIRAHPLFARYKLAVSPGDGMVIIDPSADTGMPRPPWPWYDNGHVGKILVQNPKL